jgi:hypothetical protein
MPPTSAVDPARDRRTTGIVLGVGVAIAVVVVGVVMFNVFHHSSTSSPDRTFLVTAQSAFPGVKDSALVGLGHGICATFDRNPADPAMAEYQIAKVANAYPKIQPANMVAVIRAAVQTYCPRYAVALQQDQQTTTTL